MSVPNPPYEKSVRLGIIHCSEELKHYAEKIADDIPGIIDIDFEHDDVLLHYNNNGMSIDKLAEIMQKLDIEIEDSLLNKIKLCYHSFVDANAMVNANSKPITNDTVEKLSRHDREKHH